MGNHRLVASPVLGPRSIVRSDNDDHNVNGPGVALRDCAKRSRSRVRQKCLQGSRQPTKVMHRSLESDRNGSPTARQEAQLEHRRVAPELETTNEASHRPIHQHHLASRSLPSARSPAYKRAATEAIGCHFVNSAVRLALSRHHPRRMSCPWKGDFGALREAVAGCPSPKYHGEDHHKQEASA